MHFSIECWVSGVLGWHALTLNCACVDWAGDGGQVTSCVSG